MMNLTTSYLGLKLRNPLIVSSSTLTSTVDGVVKCEKAGAGAVVLKSIFEEQILGDIKKEEVLNDELYNMNPEMQQYLHTYVRGNEIEIYTKLIKESKAAVSIPIIASINCTDKGEWTSIARKFQDAGADALELNISISPFDIDLHPKDIEQEYFDILAQVKKCISIPVAVKIGDHFTNICNMVYQLARHGADAVVLFNRFYNADIDVNEMKAVPGNALSVQEENSCTLRYISLIAGQQVPCELSASTGIYTAEDAIKQILAGATSVQICSTLYHNGLDHINLMLNEMQAWMEKHHFDSIAAFRGKANKKEDIKVLERLQYLRRNQDFN